MRLVLIGYYGAHNIGDELMLDGLIQYIENSPSVRRLYVFTGANYYSKRGKKTLFISPKMRLYRLRKVFAVLLSRCVIWGGGTCLYEASNNIGLFDIRRWQLLAHALRAKFAFLGIGIGSVCKDEIRSSISEILNTSDYTCYREEDSFNRASREFSSQKIAHVGGDLVFLGDVARSRESAKQLPKKISFSGVMGAADNYVEVYAKMLRSCINKFGSKIYFLPAHEGDGNDNILHELIAKYLPKESVVMCKWDKPDEYIETMRKMDFHVGMRLHSVILADLLAIPNVAISYSPKVESYINKSNYLSSLRLRKIGEHIELNEIQIILSQYQANLDELSQFMRLEKEAAQDSVNRLLAWCQK